MIAMYDVMAIRFTRSIFLTNTVFASSSLVGTKQAKVAAKRTQKLLLDSETAGRIQG